MKHIKNIGLESQERVVRNEYQNKYEDPMCKELTGFTLFDEVYIFAKEFANGLLDRIKLDYKNRTPFSIDALNYDLYGRRIN